MANKIFLLALILFHFSCNSEKQNEIDVKQEINALQSRADREAFLVDIFESDQMLRGEKSSEILIEFGKESKEYQQLIEKTDSIDNLNLRRVKFYLDTFKYPETEDFSEIANLTPWLIIHHSDLENRSHFYAQLKKAYEEKNLSAGHFEMYLSRTFQMKKGYFPKSEGIYNQAKKIDSLIKLLNLD